MELDLQKLIENNSLYEGRQVLYMKGQFIAGKLEYDPRLELYFLPIASDKMRLLIPPSLIHKLEIIS